MTEDAIQIRPAKADDAAAACEVLRRSISELCSRDHHNDPTVMTRWLANKMPGNVAAWIADKGSRVLVAVRAETLLAVGAVNIDGEITMNYVSPDARFKGVSRALLAELETVARDMGHQECRLVSTETARQFYLRAGYEETGTPEGRFGTSANYAMRKRLMS